MGSYGPIIQCLLGTGDETDDTKTDEFSEKFQREGGGSHFQSKILCCRFLARNLGLENMSGSIELMSRIFPFKLELILGLTQLLLE